MYNTSQFDGNAAFSGGGFMPSQATQSADPSFSPAKSRDAQALVPLTVKQIHEALLTSSDKSNFVVDGVDVNNVTIVGLVLNKVERVTDVGFVIDDGTGRIDVHRWVNESYDTKEMEGIMDGMYVRVHASLKGFQGKKQLVAYSTRPVTDFNEVTFHFLECIYVHFYNTRLRPASLPSVPQMTSSVNGTPFKGYQGAQQNQFSEAQMTSSVSGTPFRGYQGTEQNQFSGIKDLDQMVMDYLHQPVNLSKERGVYVGEIAQRLNAPLDKIMASLRTLEVEGSVYSTIDEHHYKSTAAA